MRVDQEEDIEERARASYRGPKPKEDTGNGERERFAPTTESVEKDQTVSSTGKGDRVEISGRCILRL